MLICKPENFGLPNEWLIIVSEKISLDGYDPNCPEPMDIQLAKDMGYAEEIKPPFLAYFLGTFTKEGLKMRRMPGNPDNPGGIRLLTALKRVRSLISKINIFTCALIKINTGSNDNGISGIK